MEFLPTLLITLSCALICFWCIYDLSKWTQPQEPTKKKPRRRTIWFKDGQEL
tara:strand:- start:332 stop:487 length:156 start_codon:yes stop_codon:yes gene_type:complete